MTSPQWPNGSTEVQFCLHERRCLELRAAEAERDLLAERLEKVAVAYHTSNSHPREFAVCTWPVCRNARDALARTEQA